MKKTIISVILISLISCSDNNKIKTSSGLDVDSLIQQNKKTFEVAKEANTKSDTTITNKVDNTVKKIGHLENEIKQLKEENDELKDKLDDASDAGRSFRIRAISNH